MIKRIVAKLRSCEVVEKQDSLGALFATPQLHNSSTHRLSNSVPPKGLIALMTIIIISAMILAVGISAALIGQSEIVLSGQTDREYAARNIAASCAEEGLQRLKKDAAYTGGTVPIGGETCTVVVAGGGASRTITATASSDIFTKSIVISASLRQNAAGNAKAWHVDSWAEADPP